MGLKIVYGPANSGKSGIITAAWLDSLKKGESPVLVLPTRADVNRVKKELAGRTGCIIGGRITDFDNLFIKASSADGVTTEIVSPAKRRLILTAILGKADLIMLKDSARSKGFVDAAVRSISDLLSSGIFPEKLDKSLKKLGGDEKYVAELKDIYEKYLDVLKGIGAADIEQVRFEAADHVEDSEFSNSPVYFHKFEDFTSAQKLFIKKLANISKLVVSITYEKERAALASQERVFNWLKSLSSGEVKCIANSENYSNDVLYGIERDLFEKKEHARNDSHCAGIQLLEAAGTHNEVELAASEIAKLIKGKTGTGEYKPNEVAVVVRNTDSYKAEITRTLTSYGLPFSFRRSFFLGETESGRGFLSLFKFLYITKNKRDLLSFLRSGSSGLDKRTFYKVEKRFLEGKEFLYLLENLNNDLKKTVEIALYNDSPKPALEIAEIEGLKSYLSVARSDEYSDFKAVESISNLLDDIVDLYEKDADLFSSLMNPETILKTLESVTIESMQKPEEGNIQVLSPAQARGRRFKEVFILGLNEDDFPKRKPSDPLLSNEVREKLGNLTGAELDANSMDILEEMHLFYMLVTRATQKLFLSFRSADEKGSVLLPSHFLDEFKGLFGKEARELLESEKLTKELKDIVFGDVENCPNFHEVRRKVAFDGDRLYRNLPEALIRELSNAREKAVEVRNLALIDFKKEELSVTDISGYILCPYKWFAERILRLKPFAEGFDARDIGHILHSVAHEIYETRTDSDGKINVENAQKLIDDAVELAGKKVDELSVKREIPEVDKIVALNKLRHLLTNLIMTDATSESDFHPEYFEMKFGGDGDYSAFELDGCKIKGSIDRVDIKKEANETEIAVIYDYKTGVGSNSDTTSNLIRNKDAQVLLYKKLFEKEQPGTDVVGAVYRHLGSGKSAGFTFDEARAPGLSQKDITKSEEYLVGFDDIIKNAIEGITRGSAELREEDCPGYCQLRLVCRKDES